MVLSKEYKTGYVTSADGTKIGYRQLGKGPGLILVHGGMMYSKNFMRLGELLADNFTLYIPDRRGRGLSQANSSPGLMAESEDLQALVNKTKAENIYGLSSGAIITLQTCIIEKSIKKIALHEPPILTNNIKSIPWVDKYRKAMNEGNYGRAFISVVHGTDDPRSLFNVLPGFITTPLMNIAIKSDAKKVKENEYDMNLKTLVTAMSYDIKIVEDSVGIIERSELMVAGILLIRGEKSQPYLRTTIDELKIALPKVQLKDLPGQGHTVSDNDGKPELIATELKQFFMK